MENERFIPKNLADGLGKIVYKIGQVFTMEPKAVPTKQHTQRMKAADLKVDRLIESIKNGTPMSRRWMTDFNTSIRNQLGSRMERIQEDPKSDAS